MANRLCSWSHQCVTAHTIIVVIPLTILVNGHEVHVSWTGLRCVFFLLLPGTGGGGYTGKGGDRRKKLHRELFFPFDPSFLETWTDRQTDEHIVAFIYKIVNEQKHRPLILRSRLRSRLLAGRWDFPLSWVRIEGVVSFPLRHLAGLFRSKLNASPLIFIDSFCAGAIFSSLSLSLHLPNRLHLPESFLMFLLLFSPIWIWTPEEHFGF